MGAPVYRGAGSVGGSASTSYTVALPTGCQSGDYVVVTIQAPSSATVVPSGDAGQLTKQTSGAHYILEWTGQLDANDITNGYLSISNTSAVQTYVAIEAIAPVPPTLSAVPDPFGFAEVDGFLQFFANDYYGTISDDPKVDPNSATIVSNLSTQITMANSPNGCPDLSTYQYCPPIYVVDSSIIGLTNVTETGANGHGGFNAVFSLPVPPGVTLDNSTDSSMVIFDLATSTLWEMWQFAVGTPTGYTQSPYSCTTLGKMAKGTNGMFVRSGNLSTDMASGLSFFAASIKVRELVRGQINHTMALALPYTKSGGPVPPAPYSDGGSTASYAIAEGTRFFWPANLEPPSNLTWGELAVFRAGQQYGFIVGDTAGSVILYGENKTAWTAAGVYDPYSYLFGTTYHDYNYLARLPWSSLQVLASTF